MRVLWAGSSAVGERTVIAGVESRRTRGAREAGSGWAIHRSIDEWTTPSGNVPRACPGARAIARPTCMQLPYLTFLEEFE